MLDSDRSRIRRLLMQMALSDNAPASKAVLHSMLALASLHRNDNKEHTAQLKLSALQALMTSTDKGMSAKIAIQHVAAGMLLCTFEVSVYP